MGLLFLFWTLVFLVPTSISSEDNFGFDELKSEPIRRLWGIPDTTAQIGHLFHYQIPKNAFEGNVARFKAYSEKDGLLPSWLIFHEKSGILEGVPTVENLGEHYITVKAFDEDFHSSVKDIFAVEVLSKSSSISNKKKNCNQLEEKTVLGLVLDASFQYISHKERVLIIKNLAGFLNLDINSVQLSPLDAKNEILNDAVLDAGAGNVNYRTSESSSIVQWQIGCSGRVWNKFKHLLSNVKVAAKDGTLAEVIQRPVIGWKLIKEESDFRKRREINGKMHDENILAKDTHDSPVQLDPTPGLNPFSTYDAAEENLEDVPSRLVLAITETPVFPFNPSPVYHPSSSSSHRHRHHRSIPDGISSSPVSPVYAYSTTPTYESETDTNLISPEASVSTPEDINNFTLVVVPSEPVLTDSSSTFPDENEDEIIEIRNNPPFIVQRLEKKHITAGKSLKYQIPVNVFNDTEDGGTRNLKVRLLTVEGNPLPDDSWIQFDGHTQEILALPLEEHISRWVFYLNATDSGNLTVGDKIEVTVQNHKGKRNINHAMKATLNSVPPGMSLKWQLKMLDAISKVFSDPDTSQINVLEITTNPIVFTWTNDSLYRPQCPLGDITQLHENLTNEVKGLQGKTFDGISVGKITWEGRGQCKKDDEGHVISASETENFPPLPRNPVDYLNATVGQLLVYTVPEDTFYDPEDGPTRQLKLSLVTIDRNRIAPNHWLQFDSKNQEFYGIPMPVNVGQMEYQLICEDKGGRTTNDGLVVIVHPAPRVMYNVEFSMKLNLEYKLFVEKPSLQRSFIQKLAAIFRDVNTNSIVLSGFTPGSTVITWHNRSLPTSMCPDNEILQLRKILLGDDEKVTPHVTQTMLPEFQVLGARLTPTGLCQGAFTEISPGGGETPTSDVTAISHGEQYLIGLLIPAVVIAVMLLCAGLVACILYRRRRTGKMSVGDEDERQTFRSKGIPVIFQDELDERPEPTNKSPVIMKEEKPPLPPPEYQRGPPLATTALLSDTEDSPYQPPPPFTTSRDSARPKPTPTYRMPPPYVPP